jgi:hypothetical protein
MLQTLQIHVLRKLRRVYLPLLLLSKHQFHRTLNYLCCRPSFPFLCWCLFITTICLPLLRDSAALSRTFRSLFSFALQSTVFLRSSPLVSSPLSSGLLSVTSLVLLLAAVGLGLLFARWCFLLILLLVIRRRTLLQLRLGLLLFRLLLA